MQLEAIGRITMGDLRLQVGRQIDDIDRREWAFLDANTAAYAQVFGDEGNLGVWGDFYTQLSSSNHWAGLSAFLSAFL